MTTNSEDHFRIIQLLLHENADVAAQSLPQNESNKEPGTPVNAGASSAENSPLKSAERDSDGDSDIQDDDFYAQVARITDVGKTPRHSSADFDVETAKTADAPAQAAGICSIEALEEDVKNIKKFMSELEMKNRQNPQPWKDDINRMEQQHKRELQDFKMQIAALSTQNQELTRDVNLKMEQLKNCDDWRQREHSELVQIVEEKMKQIDNLEREQLTVKTCLTAFEGLYKNLYDDINKLKTSTIENPNSPSKEMDLAQMREETVKLVRQEVIKRMDSFLDVAFQNLRSLALNDGANTAATQQPLAAPQPPPSMYAKEAAVAQLPIPTSNGSNALPSLMDINTSSVADQQTGPVNAKNYKGYGKQNTKQGYKNKQQPHSNKMNPFKQPNTNRTADPRLVQPNSNTINDPRLILDLLQANPINSILGNPPPIQNNGNNSAVDVQARLGQQQQLQQQQQQILHQQLQQQQQLQLANTTNNQTNRQQQQTVKTLPPAENNKNWRKRY